MKLNKRTFVTTLIAGLPLAAGCSTTGPSSGDPTARRQRIDAGVDGALLELSRQVPGSQPLVASAKAVLVFPTVLEAGFIFGAWQGDGALRKGGQSVSYHRTTGGTFGLQAGAQSTAVYLLFMTDEALARFENSRGWTAGVDATVTLMSVGANAQMTTSTAQAPVIGYVLSNRGLMAGVTLDGSRISRLNL